MTAMFHSLGLAWRTLSIAARLLIVAGVLASCLVSSVLTAAVPGVFRLVSSLATAVFDATQTVDGRTKAKTAELDGRLESKTAEADMLGKELHRTRAEAADLRTKNTRLMGEVSEAKTVNYRGQKVFIKDAVSDTSRRISTRTVRSTTRNVAVMPGEGIPFYGIAVVVAETGLEVNDACQMMRDMYELDVAFNADHVITDGDTVCGMRVPTAAEIWDRIKSAPDVVWKEVKKMLPDLPNLPVDEWLSTVIGWGDGFMKWVRGA